MTIETKWNVNIFNNENNAIVLLQTVITYEYLNL